MFPATGYMRGTASHKPYEVPIFFGRVGIALNVAYKFGILISRIEAERSLYHRVFQVAVDGLGTAYYLNAIAFCLVIFCQYTGICIGVVVSDDYYCFYI